MIAVAYQNRRIIRPDPKGSKQYLSPCRVRTYILTRQESKSLATIPIARNQLLTYVLLRNDDRIVGRQHDIRLRLFSVHHRVVVERQLELLAVLCA